MAQTCKAGNFTIENGTITGPAEYMREQGSEQIKEILAGKSSGFNIICDCAPMDSSIEMLICVYLQTDYAGWLGMREMMSWTKR